VTSYVLASASGLTFAFAFFLLLSAVIAFGIYALMTRPSVRRREIGLGTVRRSIATPVAFVIWVVVFSGIYFSSLAGFHTVVVSDEALRIEYAVPSRSVAVTYADVVEVTRQPAYKSLWRLEITTQHGRTYESAPGSSIRIKEAVEDIRRRRGRWQPVVKRHLHSTGEASPLAASGIQFRTARSVTHNPHQRHSRCVAQPSVSVSLR
jgi:hypothetical protein